MKGIFDLLMDETLNCKVVLHMQCVTK